MNMVLSLVRYSINYILMFSFCINEYVMAEGALFMSNQVTIEDSKVNKLKVAKHYKQLWKKRDKAVSIFNKSLVLSMLLIETANILYILIKRGGQLYKSEETKTDTLLTNLQFIVGNESIFFI